MKSIFTTLLVICAIGVALVVAAGIGIAVIGGAKITKFTYAECIMVDDFTNRMDIYNGVLLTDGDTQSGNVFVVLYPDNSFGVFVHLEEEDAVCAISRGWFAPPPVPAAAV